MKLMSLDFSQKTDLVPLAAVVRALQSVAQAMAVDFFLMGAAARDGRKLMSEAPCYSPVNPASTSNKPAD